MIYEITYILKPELTNEEQVEVGKKIAQHIQDLGGEAQESFRTFSVERGGTDENNLRKFAYPIKHYRQGYYYTRTFDLPTQMVKELDVLLSREPEVLRFLIVNDFVPLEEIEVTKPEESDKPSKDGKSQKSVTRSSSKSTTKKATK